ncbi:DUF4268 domain-containing protein [Salegentibacter sp. F188]|uniref:DUF4268 domain-containing protein n=1 Tax=Autumnicola patrickiae TaxID=3075591 RepID=A0ABU3E792_9FLAO|nr:DUF4268 domain-containing protein [Salegentibacter sp. F188]MDT0691867.1 DUF4268 domain-containing protein [Salegentibacter sp. F188]
MFSREESKKLTQEFWTTFGKKYERQWILYNTKIKEIQMKFTFDRKIAQVSLDISSSDPVIQEYYYEKLISLKKMLKSEYLPQARFEENYLLPEGKTVSRIYVQLDNVSIHNKNDWQQVQAFLAENMLKMETFFRDFEDFIRS